MTEIKKGSSSPENRKNLKKKNRIIFRQDGHGCGQV
jgi:hypothetical protein